MQEYLLASFSAEKDDQDYEDFHALLNIDYSDKKCNLSKQFTHEEGYEELRSQFYFAKHERNQLKKKIQAMKAEIIECSLSKHFKELQHLSEQNQWLRDTYTELVRKRQVKQVPKQNIMKVRKSYASVLSIDSLQLSKSQKKEKMIGIERQQNVLKLKIKGTRNSLYATRKLQHTRQESQLTERKNVPNIKIGESFCFENIQDQYSQSKIKAEQECKEQNNRSIFIKIIGTILEQEKYHDVQLQQQLSNLVDENAMNIQFKVKYINELEENIHQTSLRINKLTIVLQNYQTQVTDMLGNIKCLQNITNDLQEVKGKYIAIEKKCRNINQLKRQVKTKQQILQEKLLRKKNNQNKIQFQMPNSLKLMLKMLGVSLTNENPAQFMNEFRKILQNDFKCQTCAKKSKTKVKELIDSIRVGKSKFEELLAIYRARIAKMENKIMKLKGNKNQ